MVSPKPSDAFAVRLHVVLEHLAVGLDVGPARGDFHPGIARSKAPFITRFEYIHPPAPGFSPA